MARREMRHFGWGDPAHLSQGLPPRAFELLRARVGLSDTPKLPVAVGAIRLPDAANVDIAGVELRTDQDARVLRAAGKSYPDLFRMRTGAVENARSAKLPRFLTSDLTMAPNRLMAVVLQASRGSSCYSSHVHSYYRGRKDCGRKSSMASRAP